MSVRLAIPQEPPHSTESEQSVLGGIIRAGFGLYNDVRKVLTVKMFYVRKHQQIYAAIESVSEKHGTIDIVTIAECLESTGQLDLVGDLSYLTLLVRLTPEVSNVLTYAGIVREKYYLREIEIAYQQRQSPQEILNLQKLMCADVTGRSSPASMSAFLKLNLPKPKIMLDPWLGTQSQNIIFADAGVGKTFFTTDIAFAVATGGQYLKWNSTGKYNVLLVDSEMPRVLLQERYKLLCNRTQSNAPDNFHILSFEQFDDDVDLIQPYWQQMVSNTIDELNINLLIIDNISTAFNRDDNKQSDWQPAKQWLKRLRNTGNNGNGIAQLLVMHAGKNGTIRGTSAIADTPDIIIKLVHPDDYDEEEGARFEIHWKKHRHIWGADVKPFQAHLVMGKWECSEIEKAKNELSALKQSILDCIKQGIDNSEDIANRIGKDRKIINNELARLFDDGLIAKISRGRYALPSKEVYGSPKHHNTTNIINTDNINNIINTSHDVTGIDCVSDVNDVNCVSDVIDVKFKINNITLENVMPSDSISATENEKESRVFTSSESDLIDAILITIDRLSKSGGCTDLEQIHGCLPYIPPNGRWHDFDSRKKYVEIVVRKLQSDEVITHEKNGYCVV